MLLLPRQRGQEPQRSRGGRCEALIQVRIFKKTSRISRSGRHLQALRAAAPQTHPSSPGSSPRAELWASGAARGCSTWHDDVREAQLPGDGDTAGEEDHVLAPQLLDVAVQQLQRHGQTCTQKQS